MKVKINTNLCLHVLWFFFGIQSIYGQGFVLPELKNTPWSNESVKNKEEDFSFAILPDRTIRPRVGTFSSLLQKVDAMRPDFIMSVGNLVEGNTKSVSEYKRQWKELDSVIALAKAPFFKVGGSHDIQADNSVMRDEWINQYGATYYHFQYNQVLFLCLDTEDGGSGSISKTQLDYFTQVLKKNKKVKQAFVFMNKPLWTTDKSRNFRQLEHLLQNLNYSVFAGNLHRYAHSRRFGHDYYSLATAGGFSKLRGKEVGEIDHFIWVSFQNNQVTITNISSDGFVENSVVNDDNLAVVDLLREEKWLSIDPVVFERDSVDFFEVNITLENTAEKDMSVTGHLNHKAFNFEPSTVDLQVRQSSTVQFPITVTPKMAGFLVQNFDTIALKLKLKASFEVNGKKISIPSEKKVVLDWTRLCPTRTSAVSIDGDLADWEKVQFHEVKDGYFKNKIDWYGASDAWFRFALQKDKKFLYVAVQTFDNHSVFSSPLDDYQDQLFFHLKSQSAILELTCGLNNSGKKWLWIAKGGDNKAPSSSVVPSEEGLISELKIPLSTFGLNSNDSTFLFNIGWRDFDKKGNLRLSSLWWKPGADDPEYYEGAGKFRVEE